MWSGTNQKLLQQPAGRLDCTADNIFPNSPTQMLIQNWPLVGANNSSWHTVGLLDHSIENFLEPKTNNFHVIRRLLLLSIFWLTTTKCFRFHFHLPVNNWNIWYLWRFFQVSFLIVRELSIVCHLWLMA